MKRKFVSFLIICMSIFNLFIPYVHAEDYSYLKYRIDYWRECVVITGCDQDVTSVVVPETIDGYPVTMLQNAFRRCRNLTNVSLPDSLEIIYGGSFENCSSLKKITIPSGVYEIKPGAFLDCYNLSYIDVDTDNENYCSEDGILYDKDKTTLVIYPPNRSGSTYFIPANIVNIASRAFVSNQYIENITVSPENPSFTCINGVLFTKDCDSIIYYPSMKTDSKYIIPRSVSSIGEHAFEDCYDLKEIEFPDGLERIEACAFSEAGLTSVSIPENVNYIGEGAFELCEDLEEITLPDKALFIESWAFYYTGCYQNDEFWEDGAFYIGKHLIVYDPYHFDDYDIDTDTYTIKQGTISIASEAFLDCEFREVIFPDSVEIIGYAVFENTAIEKVTFGKGLKYIHSLAFSECYNLKEFTLPDGLEYIGEGAFGNTAITSVSIPESVKYIGDSAFLECNNLSDISIQGTVDFIGYSAFYDTAYYWDDKNIIYGGLYIGNHFIATMYYGQQFLIAPGTVTIASDSIYSGDAITIIVPNSVKNICEGAFEYSSLSGAIYLGTEEEWNQINIGDNNQALTDIITFVGADSYDSFALGNMSYLEYYDEEMQEDIKEFDIPLYTKFIPDFTEGKLVVALYNDTGALVDLKTEDIDNDSFELFVPFDSIKDATDVKVMLWSKSGITPLCHAKSAIISDIQEDI